MIRGALFVLVCAAVRKLAPVCEFESSTDHQHWYVYNEEQMSRVDSPAEVELGEYHYTTCFGKKQNIPDKETTTMYAVPNSHLVLKESAICYGWPETESTFTRGPKLSNIEKSFTYRYGRLDDCGIASYLLDVKTYSEADEYLRNLPANCSAFQITNFQKNPIKPYEGNGSMVQSFSGLATLNFDDPLSRRTEFLKVPQQSELTIKLKKEARQSDCFLLLSAYSPMTEKRLPIDYIKFEKFKKEVKYTLNRQLIASLYHMGEFELQFKNNHLTKPCEENDNIASIEAESSFQMIRTKVSQSNIARNCTDVVVINMTSIKDDIDTVLRDFRDHFFELPIKFHLELGPQNLDGVIEGWGVYTTDQELDPKDCLDITSTRELQKGSDYIISNVQSTKNGKGGHNVTAELRLQMAFGTMTQKYVQIGRKNVNIKNVQAFLSFDGKQSKRFQVDTENIVVEEKSIQIEHETVVNGGGISPKSIPLVLSKPKEKTRHSSLWKIEYYITDEMAVDRCSDCRMVDKPAEFFRCLSKCSIDNIGFAVSHSATFRSSSMPRLSGAEPHRIYGYGINLDLSPCAQKDTHLKNLKVSVAYTNIASECNRHLRGTALLNIPELTHAVYFNKITLEKFVGYQLSNVVKYGKSLSHYDFNSTLLAKIGTLPKSIIIGYYDDYKSCVDKIEKISVEYELHYTPLRNDLCETKGVSGRTEEVHVTTPEEVTDDQRTDEQEEVPDYQPTDEREEVPDYQPTDEREEVTDDQRTDEQEEVPDYQPTDEQEEVPDYQPTDEQEQVTDERPTDEQEQVTDERPTDEKKCTYEKKCTGIIEADGPIESHTKTTTQVTVTKDLSTLLQTTTPPTSIIQQTTQQPVIQIIQTDLLGVGGTTESNMKTEQCCKRARRGAEKQIEGGLSNRSVSSLCFILSAISIFLSNTQGQ